MNNIRYRLYFSSALSILAAIHTRPTQNPQGIFNVTYSVSDWLFAIFATFSLSYFFISKKFFAYKDSTTYFICPKCEKVQTKLAKNTKHVCPNCGCELVMLEGFFKNKR